MNKRPRWVRIRKKLGLKNLVTLTVPLTYFCDEVFLLQYMNVYTVFLVATFHVMFYTSDEKLLLNKYL